MNILFTNELHITSLGVMPKHQNVWHAHTQMHAYTAANPINVFFSFFFSYLHAYKYNFFICELHCPLHKYMKNPVSFIHFNLKVFNLCHNP